MTRRAASPTAGPAEPRDAAQVADRWRDAMRLLVVSLAQPGGTRREVLGSAALTWIREVKGITASQATDGHREGVEGGPS